LRLRCRSACRHWVQGTLNGARFGTRFGMANSTGEPKRRELFRLVPPSGASGRSATNSLLLPYDDSQSIDRERRRRGLRWASVGIEAQGRPRFSKVNDRKWGGDFGFRLPVHFGPSGRRQGQRRIPVVHPEFGGRHGARHPRVGGAGAGLPLLAAWIETRTDEETPLCHQIAALCRDVSAPNGHETSLGASLGCARPAVPSAHMRPAEHARAYSACRSCFGGDSVSVSILSHRTLGTMAAISFGGGLDRGRCKSWLPLPGLGSGQPWMASRLPAIVLHGKRAPARTRPLYSRHAEEGDRRLAGDGSRGMLHPAAMAMVGGGPADLHTDTWKGGAVLPNSAPLCLKRMVAL
jgi:hypothetical protein